MKRGMLLTLAAPLVALAFVAQPVVLAQPERPEPPSLVVVGNATVEAEPDQIEIGLSVVTEGEQSKTAAEENNRKAVRILEALRRAGLDAKEVTTGAFQIQPMYSTPDPRTGGDAMPRIRGFRVENSISIKTRQLAIGSDAIQSAVDAGANRVQYVRFTLSEPGVARMDALRQAVQNARAEATTVAAAAGITIKGIRRVHIDQVHTPAQHFRGAMMQDASAPGPPLVAGSVAVAASVTIEFDISGKQPEHP